MPRVAIWPHMAYHLTMATKLHQSLSKAGSISDKLPRATSAARLRSIAALKPVTKRATITSAQAAKVVKDYLDTNRV